MGSRAVRDLVEQPEVEALTIGDYDEAEAQALSESLNDLKVKAVQVDANDHESPVLSRIGRPGNPCSGVRVDVKGTKGGQRAKVTYGAADHMNNLTSIFLAIGAVMLGRGDITHLGVVAPEACIAPEQFIRELAKREIKLYEGDRLEAVLV